MQHASRDIRHKAIRAALKLAFPGTKFSVTGSRGTGYGWSRVSWTDGPSDHRVRACVAPFFGSQFNGSIDGYDPTHNYFTFEGETYSAGGSGFNTTRDISPAFARRLLAAVVEKYGDFNTPQIIDTTDWKGRPDWKLSDDNSTPLGNTQGDYHWTHGALMRRAAEDRAEVAV